MRKLALSSFLLVALVFSSSLASAGDASDCNDVELTADAECSVVVETECTTQCEPTSFVLQCDGECTGTCNETATTECTEECDSWCITECEVEPASFSCEASCKTDCETACPGKCHDHPSSGECENSCRAQCDTECTASCTAIPASATCETKCGTCCDTSCTVQHNVECEVSCAIGCTGELEVGCETQCEDPHGALFCDGQFVDSSDVEECVDYLESTNVSVDVDAWADIDASCEGNTCHAEGEAGITCAALPGGPTAGGAALLGGFALVALALFRRRRRTS